MNPFFFGDSDRQLFGVYHPARRPSQRGVVICAPWAREYLLSHPTLKMLAHKLADSGSHVLRFDYYATGDSAGDGREGHRDQWLEDISVAIDELQAIAGVTEIALVGMRYGATLAAMTAGARRDLSHLVLWDPIVDGHGFLAEQGVGDGPFTEVDVLGAVLTPRLRSDFSSVTTATFNAALPRTLVVSTGADDAIAAVADAMRMQGVDCSVERVSDVQVWREEWGRGGKGLAVSTANCVAGWLN